MRSSDMTNTYVNRKFEFPEGEKVDNGPDIPYVDDDDYETRVASRR